jgi:hypothetical protein
MKVLRNVLLKPLDIAHALIALAVRKSVKSALLAVAHTYFRGALELV